MMSTQISQRLARLSPEHLKLLAQKLRQQTAQAGEAIPLQPRNAPPSSTRFPLSFSQQRLWFLCQIASDAATYNNPIAARLRLDEGSRIDLVALGEAVNEVTGRHEVLRTTFEEIDGEPLQVIAPSVRIPVRYVDLCGEPDRAREERALGLLREDARLPFDIARGPLLRVTVLQLTRCDYMLQINTHHLISDAWSVGVLLTEIMTIVAAKSAQLAQILPRLSLQYADFAVWQRSYLQGPVYERLARYWREKLAGPLPVLRLPGRRAVGQDGPRGATHFSALSSELTRQVNEYARRKNTTPFAVLLATYELLLRRYTREEDIIVGTPVANRTRREIEPLLGCFINTLVLRTDMTGVGSFDEAVVRVTSTAIEAFAHQEFPFELLVKELQPRRDSDATPLFQTLFVLQNAPIETVIPGGSLRAVNLDNATAKFDLTLTAQELHGELALNWNYRRDLFDASLIEGMARHYGRLLASMLERPDAEVESMPLLDEAEYAEIAAWHSSANAVPGRLPVHPCFHDWFDAVAAKHADAPALFFEEQVIRYSELRGRVTALARRLRAAGVERGEVVGVLLERSPEAVIAMLAAMKAGAAYLPIDVSWPAQRSAAVVKIAGARVVQTTASFASRLPAESLPLLLDQPFSAGDEELPATAPECLAYVIFTSGTSGEPKGIAVEHRQLVRYTENILEHMALPDGSRFAVVSTLCADLAHTMIFPALASGGALLLASEAQAGNPEQLVSWLHARDADALKIVPSHLDSLLEVAQAQRLLPRKLLVLGGEACPPGLRRKLAAMRPACRLLNHYGPTETTVGVVVGELSLEPAAADQAVLGRPLGDARVYICDGKLNPVPAGVPGELCIGGPTVARGYIGRPDLTSERFLKDPFSGHSQARLYRSGDLARWRRDGAIEFLGRIDNQVKIRGYRIEPAEVEAAVRAWPGARDAAVKAVDWRGSKELAAWVVPQGAADRNGLLGFLRERLADAMIPSLIHFIHELPLTPNGKVDRNALHLAAEDETLRAAPSFVAPRNNFELGMVHLWEEVLQRSPIGVQDDFFDLGGHSLVAVRLLAAVQRQFNYAAPLSSLFQNATVEKLARLISQNAPPPEASPVVPIQPKGDRTPLFFVHPAGGNVLCYYDLARELGAQQPFYGLQALPHSGDEDSSIEAMAASYVRSLQQVQPAGPYQIGGWSMGGIVAFEMARQLRQQGQIISVLAIADIPAPGRIARHDRDRIDDAAALAIYARKIELFSNRTFGLTAQALRALSPDERIERLLAALRETQMLPDEISAPQLRRFMEMQKAHNYATLSYVAGAYDGPVTVIRCKAPPGVREEADALGLDALYEDETLGWAAFCDRPPALRWVDGNHITMMVPPHVAGVAAALRELLR